MPYTPYVPPDGDDVQIDLTGAYTPPVGNDVEFDFPSESQTILVIWIS